MDRGVVFFYRRWKILSCCNSWLLYTLTLECELSGTLGKSTAAKWLGLEWTGVFLWYGCGCVPWDTVLARKQLSVFIVIWVVLFWFFASFQEKKVNVQSHT